MRSDGSDESVFRSEAQRRDSATDKKRSLSMLMTLGMLLANGARADARDSRERMQRQLERADNARRSASIDTESH